MLVEVPSNLSIGGPRPPFIDNFVSDRPCPGFTASEWNTHIMIPTARIGRKINFIRNNAMRQ